MSFNKNKVFLTSLLILVALSGVVVGRTIHKERTIHKVGDSKGWTMMGVNYETWASSRTFQVGDSLVFQYNDGFHDVTEVTHNDFELCESSKPLMRYVTGSDTISLTKPGLRYFICGTPGHCNIGQKVQIHVLPASLGSIAAPVPGPVRSQSSSSSPSPSPLADHSQVSNAPQSQMGPSSAPISGAASKSSLLFGLFFIPLVFLFILL